MEKIDLNNDPNIIKTDEQSKSTIVKPDGLGFGCIGFGLVCIGNGLECI